MSELWGFLKERQEVASAHYTLTETGEVIQNFVECHHCGAIMLPDYLTCERCKKGVTNAD